MNQSFVKTLGLGKKRNITESKETKSKKKRESLEESNMPETLEGSARKN